MCAMTAELELDLGRLIQDPAAGRKPGAAWWNVLQRTERDEEELRMLRLMMGPLERPSTAVAVAAPSLQLQLQLMANTPSSSAGSTVDGGGGGGTGNATLDLLGAGAGAKGRVPSVKANHCFQSQEDACSGSPGLLELDSQSTVPLPSGWEKCLDLQTGSIYYLNRSAGLRTSSDPRLKTPQPQSINNWPPPTPTSPPSSSSDLTSEGVAATAAPAASSATKRSAVLPACPPNPLCFDHIGAAERLSIGPNSADDLDLTLSLKPCIASATKPSPSSTRSLNAPAAAVDPYGNGWRRPTPSSQIISHNRPSLDVMASCISRRGGPATRSGAMSPITPASALDTNSSGAPTPKIQWGDTFSRKMGQQPLSSNADAPSTSFVRANVDGEDSVSAPRTATISSQIHSSSPATMMTVGCANCLMFVMVPPSCNPKCPRCGAAVQVTELPQPPACKKARKRYS